MDQLEQAIIVSSDPVQSNAVRHQAAQFINNFLAQQDGWKCCLQKLFTAKQTEITFFCLETLRNLTLSRRYDTLTTQERSLLKDALFQWLLDYVPKQKLDPAVKGKFAQVIVSVFSVEYPTDWPDFFQKLGTAVTLQPFSEVRIELYLQILHSIEELISMEFVRNNADIAHSNKIKDAMRASDCITQLVITWYNILNDLSDQFNHLKKLALKNIKHYIGWIDIQYIVNENYLRLFDKLLKKSATRNGVCQCLEQVISKGMERRLKQKLLEQLQLHQMIATIQVDDLDFIENLSKLVNTLGLQSIDCRSDAHRTSAPPEFIESAEKLVDQSITLCFRFLSNEDDGISECIFPFINLYIYKLRHTPLLSEKILGYLSTLLEIIAFKMKFDATYNFENEEDSEAEFLDFRKELEKIFRNIARLAPELTFSFLGKHLTRLLSTDCTVHKMEEIERFLRLLFVIGEGLGAPSSKDTQFIQNMMILIMNSNISSFPSPVVLISVFEILSRYTSFIPKQPTHLQAVLLAFLDTRGIRHPNPKVRSRTCYLFLKVVKDLMNDLRPYFKQLLASILPLLKIQLLELDQPLLDEDQQNLYEVAGSITYILRFEPETHKEIIQKIMDPLVTSIEEILTKRLFANDPPENPQFSSYLVRAMSAIATFSKGFTASTPEATEIFRNVLRLEIQALQLLPMNDDIRSKVTFFLHRMIECMQKDIFPYLPNILDQILHPLPSTQSFIGVTRIVNQLTTRFKSDFFQILDHILFEQIVQKLFAFHQSLDDVSEQRELQKAYFFLIQGVCQNKLTAVFFTERNSKYFSQFFETIVQGASAISTDSAKTVKVCFSILYELLEQQLSKMDQLIAPIIDACYIFCLTPLYDPINAECIQVVSVIVKIHCLLLSKSSSIGTFLVQRAQARSIPTSNFQSFLQVAARTNFKPHREVITAFNNAIQSTSTTKPT